MKNLMSKENYCHKIYTLPMKRKAALTLPLFHWLYSCQKSKNSLFYFVSKKRHSTSKTTLNTCFITALYLLMITKQESLSSVSHMILVTFNENC